MANKSGETWLCPTCSLERFPYGEPCPTWATNCINMETPNINGEIYKRRNGQPLDTSQQLTAVGIAAIADEDSGASSRPLGSKHDE